MSNYSLNNIKRGYSHINESDYWDFHINKDDTCHSDLNDDECLASFIDTENDECIEGENLVSLSDFTYKDACSIDLDLKNIGLTGVDNGLIRFRKDRVTNEEFYKLYTQSEYIIESDDLRLHLHPVSGSTLLYDYPLSRNDDGSIKLNGGFYQGFFRHGNTYSILPSKIENRWNLEFVLKKEDYKPESEKTLNGKYPSNKGIFFYIGTRAQNKWVYLYNNLVSGSTNFNCCGQKGEYFDMVEPSDGFDCNDGNDYFDLVDEDIDLEDKEFKTDNGFDIDSPNDDYVMSDNKFLMFDRTKTGITVSNYEGNEEVLISYKKRKYNGNLFEYLNRTPTGYTAENIDSLTSEYTEKYDMQKMYSDIYENAFALKINDDGSIGYRYAIKDCSVDAEGHLSILEGSSFPNVIKISEWAKINVIFKSNGQMMKLYFYVNGKLKYITKEMPTLNLHKLDEIDEKQEGVPFNISIGGGTQGLSETIMPDYMSEPTEVFDIERHFGGSFIGDFKSFKFHTC